MQGFKTFLLIVAVMAFAGLPKLRYFDGDLSLMLFLQVVIPAGVFAMVGCCTKILGFCASIISFIEIFVLSLEQDGFCLNREKCDIAVPVAIIFTFVVGLLCYTMAIVCFYQARDFQRQVYKDLWFGDQSVNMWLPNRTWWEFIMLKKSQKTNRLETDLVR